MEALKDLTEQFQANNKMMNDQEKTAEERIKEIEEQNKDEKIKIDLKKPYFTNLNEDPSLSGKVQY